MGTMVTIAVLLNPFHGFNLMTVIPLVFPNAMPFRNGVFEVHLATRHILSSRTEVALDSPEGEKITPPPAAAPVKLARSDFLNCGH